MCLPHPFTTADGCDIMKGKHKVTKQWRWCDINQYLRKRASDSKRCPRVTKAATSRQTAFVSPFWSFQVACYCDPEVMGHLPYQRNFANGVGLIDVVHVCGVKYF